MPIQIKISGDSSEYNKSVDDAVKATKQMEAVMKQASSGPNTLRQGYKAAMKEVQNLTNAYSRLSDEMRSSDIGQRMKQQLDSAKQSAADYLDQLSDIQAEIKNMASDTAVWDTAKTGIDAMAGALTTMAGVAGLVSDDEKTLKNVISTVTIVQGAANTAITLGNALQKQSSLMLGIRRLQEAAAAKSIAARAAAEKSATGATITMTAAQKAFNIVANANPYVLIATALVAAGGAIWAFTSVLNKSNAELEIQKRSNENVRKTAEDAAQAYINARTELYKYKQQIRDFNGTADEEKRLIDELNSKYGEQMGYYDKLSKWKKTLIEQSETYCNMLKEEARAGAVAQKIGEIYVQRVTGELSKEAYSKLSAQLNKAYDESLRKSSQLRSSLSSGITARGGTINRPSLSGTGRNNTNTVQLTGIQQADRTYADTISTLNDKRKAQYITEEQRQDELLKALQQRIDAYFKTGQRTREQEAVLVQLINEERELSTSIQNRKTWEDNLAAADEAAQRVLEQQRENTQDLRNDVHNTTAHRETAAQQFGPVVGFDAQDAISELQDVIDRYDALKATIDDVKAQGEGFVDPAALKEAEAALKSLEDEMHSLSSAASDLFTQETFGGDIFKDTLQQMQDLATVLQSNASDTNKAAAGLAVLGEQMQALGGDGAVAKMGAVLAAVGQIILGFATASAQASKMGAFGWLAFMGAGLATVATVISTIKSFKGGGIIDGPTTVGDRVLARVNSGEMILNQRQQGNLFKLLDEGAVNGANNVVIPKVKIEGTDLYILFDNMNKIKSRSGRHLNL